MESGMADYERVVAPVKRDLFADLAGADVVEVGMGPGPSLPLFQEAGVRSVRAVEPNVEMHPLATARAARCGLQRLQLSTGVAEELPLPDDSCDVLVATMLMCSVSSPQRALREFVRVLRPGGRYIFIEHVAAPAGSALRGLQGALDVPQQLMCNGCHLTRSPLAALEAEPSFRGRVHARCFSLGAPAGTGSAWSWESPARRLEDLQAAGGAQVTGISQGWQPGDGLPPPAFLAFAARSRGSLRVLRGRCLQLAARSLNRVTVTP
jgi:SAM-dependent methyltransferase